MARTSNVSVKVDVDIKAKMNDVESKINNLQNKLKGITLFDDSKKTGLESAIANARKQIESINKTTSSGLNLDNSGDATKSLRALEQELISIERYTNSIGKNDIKFHVDSKEVDDLKTKLKEAQDALMKSPQTSGLTKSLEEMRKFFKEGSSGINPKAIENAMGAINTGDFDKLTESIRTLEKESRGAFTSIHTNVQKMSDGTEADKAVERYRELLDTLKRFKEVNLGDTSEIGKIGSALDSINASAVDKLVSGLQKSGQAAANSSSGVQSLGDKIAEATNHAQLLENEMVQLTNRVTDFFGMNNAVDLFKRKVEEAWETIKELDKSMTETATVTNFSVGDLWDKLPEYTKSANDLGATINDVVQGTTLYYQQGLNTNQAFGLTAETLKMARIAGMGAAESTDAMTAALRGFNLELNKAGAQKVNDIYSKLAAVTASDTGEISTAMTKTASLAHNAGMDIETTTAYLAKAIETTREAPENIGTAMKTIIARFQEIKKNPIGMITDDSGEYSYNKVDTALQSIGVQMKKSNGDFKGLGEIFNEISARWDGLTQAQQRYIATQAAGGRQQSRFIAMMSDYGKTQELLSAAYNSAGAGQEQFEKTLDSLDSKLNQLQNAWDTFITTIVPRNLFSGIIDGATGVLTVVNNLTNALGPLSGAAKLAIGSLAFLKGGKLVTKAFGAGARAFMDTAGFGVPGKDENKSNARNDASASAKRAEVTASYIARSSKKAFQKEMNKGDITFDSLFKNMETLGTKQGDFVGKSKGFVEALKSNLKGEINFAFPSLGKEASEKLMETFSSSLGEKGGAKAFAELKDNLKNSLKLDSSIFEGINFDELKQKIADSSTDKGAIGKKIQQELATSFEGISDIGKQEGQEFAKELTSAIVSGGDIESVKAKLLEGANARRNQTIDNLGNKKASSNTIDQYSKSLDKLGGSMSTVAAKGQDFSVILGALGLDKASDGVMRLAMALGSAGSLMDGALTGLVALPTTAKTVATSFIAAAHGTTTLGAAMASGASSAAIFGAALGTLALPLAALVAIGFTVSKIKELHAKRMEDLNNKIKDGENVTKNYNKALKETESNTNKIQKTGTSYGRALEQINKAKENGGTPSKGIIDNYNKQAEAIAKTSKSFKVVYDGAGQAQVLYNGKVLEGNQLIQTAVALQEKEAQAIERKYKSQESYNKMMTGAQASFEKYEKKQGGFSTKGAFTDTFLGYYSGEGTRNVKDLINLSAKDVNKNRKKNINFNDLSFEDIQDLAKSSESIKSNMKQYKGMFNLKDGDIDTITYSLDKVKKAYNEIEKLSGDTTKWIQQDVSNTFTNLKDAPRGFVNSMNNELKEISMKGIFEGKSSNEIRTEATNFAKKLSDSWEKNGSKIEDNMDSILDAQQRFEETGDLSEYRRNIAGAVDSLRDLKNATKDADLKEFYQNQIDLANNYRVDVKSLSEVFNELGSDIAGAESAGQNFTDSLKSMSDYYTGLDSLKTIYDKIINGKDNAGNGSKTFWKGAEELLDPSYLQKNISNFDKVNKKIQNMKTALEGGQKGADAFLISISKLIDKGKSDEIGITRKKDGTFDFHQSEQQISNLAKQLGYSKEATASMMNNLQQFSKVSLVNIKELPKSLQQGKEALNSITSSYSKINADGKGGTIANYNTLREKAKEANPQKYNSTGANSAFQKEIIDTAKKAGISILNLQKDSAQKIIQATNAQTKGIVTSKGDVRASDFTKAFSQSGAFSDAEISSALNTIMKSGRLINDDGSKVRTMGEVSDIQQKNTQTDPIVSTTQGIKNDTSAIVGLLKGNNGEVKTSQVEGATRSAEDAKTQLNMFKNQAATGSASSVDIQNAIKSNQAQIDKYQKIYDGLSEAGKNSVYGKEIKSSIDSLIASNKQLESTNKQNSANLTKSLEKQGVNSKVANGLAEKTNTGNASQSMASANSYLQQNGVKGDTARGAMRQWSANVGIKINNEEGLKSYLKNVEQLSNKRIETVFNADTPDDKIKNYIAAIDATPETKETLAEFVNDYANGNIEDLDARINALPPEVRTIARAITNKAFGNLESLNGLILKVDDHGNITISAKTNTKKTQEALTKLQGQIKKTKKGGTITLTANAKSPEDATKKAKKLGEQVKDAKVTVNGNKIVMKANSSSYENAIKTAQNLKTEIGNLPEGTKNLNYVVTYTEVGKKPKEHASTGKNNRNIPKRRVAMGSMAKGSGKTQSDRRYARYLGSAAKGGKGRLGPNGKGGATLTGERGPELVWEPRTSRSYVVGNGGPEVVNLPKDATVYTASQTKDILGGRQGIEFGSAATGTARISGGAKKSSSSSKGGSKKSSGGSSKSKSSKSKGSKKKGSKGSKKSGGGSFDVSPTSLEFSNISQVKEVTVKGVGGCSIQTSGALKLKVKKTKRKGAIILKVSVPTLSKDKGTITVSAKVKGKTKRKKVTVTCSKWDNPYDRYTDYDERTSTRDSQSKIDSTNQSTRELTGQLARGSASTVGTFDYYAQRGISRAKAQKSASDSIAQSAQTDIRNKMSKSANNKGNKYYSWSAANGFTQSQAQLNALNQLAKQDAKKGEAVQKEIEEIQRLDGYYKKATEDSANQLKTIQDYNKSLRDRTNADIESIHALQKLTQTNSLFKATAKQARDSIIDKRNSIEKTYGVDIDNFDKVGQARSADQVRADAERNVASARTDQNLASQNYAQYLANAKSMYDSRAKELEGIGEERFATERYDVWENVQVPIAQPSSTAKKTTKKATKKATKKLTKPKYVKLTLKNYKKKATKSEKKQINKAKSKKAKQKVIDKLNTKRKKEYNVKLKKYNKQKKKYGSAAKGSAYGRIGGNGQGGLTLTGEEGQELVWLPNESSSFLVGVGSPEMVNLPKDAVVYTAKETEEILKNRRHEELGSHAKKSKKKTTKKKATKKSTKKSSKKKSTKKKSTKKKSTKKKATPKKATPKKTPAPAPKPATKPATKTVRQKKTLTRTKSLGIDYDYFSFDEDTGTVFLTDDQQKRIQNLSDSARKEILDLMNNINAQGGNATQEMLNKLEAKEKELAQYAQNKTNQDAKNEIDTTYGVYDRLSKEIDDLENVRERLSNSYTRAFNEGNATLESANANLEKQKSALDKEMANNNAIIEQAKKDLAKKGTGTVSTLYDAYGNAIGGVNLADYVTVDSANGKVTVSDAQAENLKALVGDPNRSAMGEVVKARINELRELASTMDKAGDSNDKLKEQLYEINQQIHGWVNEYAYAYNWTQKINGLLTKRNRIESEYQNLIARGEYSRQNTGGGLAQSLSQARALNSANNDSYLAQSTALMNQRKELENKLRDTLEGSGNIFGSVGDNGRVDNLLMKSFKDVLDLSDIANGVVTVNQEQLDKIVGSNTQMGAQFETYLGKVNDLAHDIAENTSTQAELTSSLYGRYKEDLDKYNSLITSVVDAIVDARTKVIENQKSIGESIADSDSKLLDGIQDAINKSRQARENSKTEKELAEQRRQLAYMSMDTSGGNLLTAKELQKTIKDSEESFTDKLVDQKLDNLRDLSARAQTQREEQIQLQQAQLSQDKANGNLVTEASKLVEQAVNGNETAVQEIYKLLSPKVDNNGVMITGAQMEANQLDINNSILEGTRGLGASFNPDGSMSEAFKKSLAATLGNFDIVTNETSSSIQTSGLQKYASGGLNRTTGLAWLDGTYSKPELVLNAQDTANFLALRDSLRREPMQFERSAKVSGDNYFKIDINVDKIESDYDVDRMAKEIERKISSASSYRNITAIKNMR